VAAVAGALLIGAALVPYGPGITPDSVHYLSAAANLRQGLGYATSVMPWDGPLPYPLAAWPPLYPAVLAVVTGLAGTNAGPWVLNALLLAASAWLATRSAEPMPLLGALILLASPAVIGVHAYVWSEPLFLLLVLLALRAQERMLAEPGAGHLAGAAALAGLACLTRYLGVTLAVSGALTLVVRRRPLQALSYAALSVAPLGLWLLRNRSVAGTFTGRRGAGGEGVLEPVRQALDTLGGWLVPMDGRAAHLGALVLAAVVLAWALRGGMGRAALPWLAFVGVYLVVMVALAATVSFDPLGDRLLAPVVPALAVLAARSPAAVPVPGKAAPAVALAILLVAAPALVTARSVAYAALVTKGRGYRAARWRELDAVRLARQVQGTLYSDAADVLFLDSGRPVRYLPEASAPVEELYRRSPTIVLTGQPTRPGLLGRDELLRSGLFRVERTLGRGAVLLPVGGS
jgi:hypothetical protein